MRKRSIPSSTSTGQTTSRNAAAMTRVPSEVLGATFFVANATAKWPMNTSPSLPEQRLFQAARHRIAAQPDPEQRAVEVLADDGLALGLAVEDDARSGSGQPVERDHVALLRGLQRVHDGGKLGQAPAQGLTLRGGCVVADALLERIDQLLGAQRPHHVHGDALGARKREHFFRESPLFR